MENNLMDLEAIKLSLRIDHSYDNAMIEGYISAAQTYVKNAVDVDATKDDLSLYEAFSLAVSLLVQYWYVNRTESVEYVSNAVVSLIQQLRGEYYAKTNSDEV
ncbi:head-tail connector protein [Kurthia senegalensis]|uniref:head-tail connector protein n=1 Tax=Kurthia senegalensis TaxID=1033740 RepID=UPI0002887690|nr:head-tail connector protein [Kurthia senegalensis]